VAKNSCINGYRTYLFDSDKTVTKEIVESRFFLIFEQMKTMVREWENKNHFIIKLHIIQYKSLRNN